MWTMLKIDFNFANITALSQVGHKISSLPENPPPYHISYPMYPTGLLSSLILPQNPCPPSCSIPELFSNPGNPSQEARQEE